MSEKHENLEYFIKNHKKVYDAYREYGKTIHENSGPLDEKTRWLVKIAVSAASGFEYALVTHIEKALDAGVTHDEIEHTLLLIAPTVGFPRMMEALLHYRNTQEE